MTRVSQNAQSLLLFIVVAALLTGSITSAKITKRAPGLRTVAGRVFRDCPNCPEMVVIPAGTFTMGSSAAERLWAVSHGATPGSVSDEAPQHNVSIRAFALGKYDVTRREYAEFVRETHHSVNGGCYDNGNPDSPKRAGASWQHPGFRQTDRDPIICVSWHDAQAYVAWLNRKVRPAASATADGPYRLPSESEWEYAARAGTTTRFWWGEDDNAAPNHAWYKGNSGGQTHPVGLKDANGFGLYDMSGNVWQWTQDCYAETYTNAPTDGSAAGPTEPCLRVDRGGSWYYPSWLLRSATRERNPAGYRDMVMGFRVARTLPAADEAAARQGAPADLVYTQPGQLVEVNGFQLNLYCMGTGSPTVVFDSGWEDWAPSWSRVQPEVAKWTRACSYDRAGAGFSDPGPLPRTSERIAQELRTALHRSRINGPYILVGHAFGGDNVRTFASLYMNEVAGLVLVDADPTDSEPKEMQERENRGRIGIISQLRACRDAIAEHKTLPALGSRPGQPQRTCAQQFFRGLPEAEWSPELNARLLDIAQTKVAMYDAFISEMEEMARDEAYLQQHQRSFGSRPIRVLTSGNHGVGHLDRKPPDTPEYTRYEEETTRAQARWLQLSSNAKQIFVHHSSEYIQFDQPETVINAIRELYNEAKRVNARISKHLASPL